MIYMTCTNFDSSSRARGSFCSGSVFNFIETKVAASAVSISDLSSSDCCSVFRFRPLSSRRRRRLAVTSHLCHRQRRCIDWMTFAQPLSTFLREGRWHPKTDVCGPSAIDFRRARKHQHDLLSGMQPLSAPSHRPPTATVLSGSSESRRVAWINAFDTHAPYALTCSVCLPGRLHGRLPSNAET